MDKQRFADRMTESDDNSKMYSGVNMNDKKQNTTTHANSEPVKIDDLVFILPIPGVDVSGMEESIGRVYALGEHSVYVQIGEERYTITRAAIRVVNKDYLCGQLENYKTTIEELRILFRKSRKEI